jgi:hypothetical protein
MMMPSIETNDDEDWKAPFLETEERVTPSRDYQHGWKLTAVTVTLGILAILALST